MSFGTNGCRLPPAVAAVLATALLAMACSDSLSKQEQAIDAVVDGIVADETLADFDPPVDELRCVGEELVATLGADRVLGLYRTVDAPPALSPEETEALAVAFDRCLTDIEEITVAFLAAELRAEGADGALVTPSEATCVAEAVTAGIPLADLFLAGRTSDEASAPLASLPEESAQVFAAAYVDCVDARGVLLEQIGAEGASQDEVECFDEAISDDALIDFFTARFAGDEAPDVYRDATDRCF